MATKRSITLSQSDSETRFRSFIATRQRSTDLSRSLNTDDRHYDLLQGFVYNYQDIVYFIVDDQDFKGEGFGYTLDLDNVHHTGSREELERVIFNEGDIECCVYRVLKLRGCIDPKVGSTLTEYDVQRLIDDPGTTVTIIPEPK